MILASHTATRLWFEWHLSLRDLFIGLRWEKYAWGVVEVTVCPLPGCVFWFHWDCKASP